MNARPSPAPIEIDPDGVIDDLVQSQKIKVYDDEVSMIGKMAHPGDP